MYIGGLGGLYRVPCAVIRECTPSVAAVINSSVLATVLHFPLFFLPSAVQKSFLHLHLPLFPFPFSCRKLATAVLYARAYTNVSDIEIISSC